MDVWMDKGQILIPVDMYGLFVAGRTLWGFGGAQRQTSLSLFFQEFTVRPTRRQVHLSRRRNKTTGGPAVGKEGRAGPEEREIFAKSIR